MTGFLPPVLFEVKANATEAIAAFREVNADLKAMEAQAIKTGEAISGMTKATRVATAATKALGVAVAAFAIYGVVEVTKLQTTFAGLGQALANQGLASKENLEKIQKLVEGYKSLGFSADEAASGFQTLVTATGDVAKSTNLLAVAADLARVRHISLAEASTLVARATGGAAKLFTQYHIELDKSKPKAQAAAEAMQKLADKIHGQAEKYTHTFMGELKVLGAEIQSAAEKFGAFLLPALEKFVGFVKGSIEFLGKHKEALVVLAAAITGVITVAVINLTKKLYAQAAAWAIANFEMVAIIAAIVALAAAFVWAWNKFDWFRKGVVMGIQAVLGVVKYLIDAILLVGKDIFDFMIAPLRLLLKIAAAIPSPLQSAAKAGLKVIGTIDSGIDSARKSSDAFFDSMSKKAYGLKDKKIDLNFKLPGIDIPGYTNETTKTTTDNIGKVSDAAVAAMQKVKDFNQSIVEAFNGINASLTAITTKDFAAAIQEGLLNPVDKLIVKAQKAVDVYQGAANGYAKANETLIAAQDAYTKAVDSTDAALVASTTSALKHAEDVVKGLTDDMAKSLEDLTKLQDDMISSIVDTYNQIADLEKQRTDVIDQSRLDRLAAEKDYLSKMAQLHKDYDKNVADAQAAAAQKTLDVIKTSVDRLRNVYQTATQKNVGDIYSGLTFGGLFAKGGNVSALTGSLKTSLGKAQTLADDAGKLSGLGFSQTFIEQVVAQGPDIGHKLAQQILTSSPDSVAELKKYWEALDKQSQHGVDAVAQQMNSGLTLATEELTAQLAQVGKDLNVQLAQYAQDLADASATTLSDYNATLDAIKAATDKKVKELDDSIAAAKARIAQMQAALAALAGLGNGNVNLTPTSSIIPIPTTSGGTVVPIPLSGGATIQPAVNNGLFVGPIPSGSTRTATGYTTNNNVTVNVTSYATASAIADSTAWAVRTSSDIQYTAAQQQGLANKLNANKYTDLVM